MAELTGKRGGTPAITEASSVVASGAIPGRARKRGRVSGRALVDNGETGVDHRAMAGIGGAGDRGREDDGRPLLKRDEGVVQAGSSGARPAPVMATRRPSSARRASAERIWRSAGVSHAAVDMRHRRKRRVHQDDARADAGVEMIVDLRRVEARDGQAGEKPGEKPGAGIGELVERERSAASSARIARRPVPAEGSSTRSPA